MTRLESELELATGSPEELFDLFESRGWGDGLPVVPPTKDRVEAMLDEGGASGQRPADEVIATLPPRIRTPARRLRPSGSSSPLKIQFMIY